MYKALYPYNSAGEGTLTCSQDDLFCVMGKDASKQWLQVANEKGLVGYLPTNYLQFCSWADEEFTLRFIDEAIGFLYSETKTDQSHRERLRILLSLRGNITAGFEAFLSALESKTVSAGDAPPTVVESNSSPPKDPAEQVSADSDELNDNLTAQQLADDLMETLSATTGLSHDLSRMGLAAVLDVLIKRNTSQQQLHSVASVLNQKQTPSLVRESKLVSDGVVKELSKLFESVTECKDDSQQRSWHLHDDLEFIHAQLSQILDILTGTDPSNKDDVASYILSEADNTVHSLVLYYQMETRTELRRLLLQVFAALCTLSEKLISALLCSVLPLELIKLYMCTEQADDQLVLYSAIVLSMIFSTGETPPYTHNASLGPDFVDYILNTVESCDCSDRLRYVSVELLLSFNLHQSSLYESSVVLHRLASRLEASRLTERFLYLFNRAEDPVVVVESSAQPNSLLKLASDIYSNTHTSQLLYTNDLLVLIDVILRQITNLSLHDQDRLDYLRLMNSIITNTEYVEHKYKISDLVDALNGIEFMEETDEEVIASNTKLKLRQEEELSVIRDIRAAVASLCPPV